MGMSLPARVIEKLDSITFDELLAGQHPFENGNSLFDLTGTRLITSAAITQLAAACYAANVAGDKPKVVVDDSGVRSYLVRSGFVGLVEPVAQIEPGFRSSTFYGLEGLRGSNPMLIELTKIDDGSELPGILDQIVWVLQHRLRYRKSDAFDVAVAVSEIAQNTFDHNKKAFGFLAMQVYGERGKQFLEIGVADCGAGLTETLRRNPRHALISSDLEAIRAATELGTSEYEDCTRGSGLHYLLEIAYKHQGAVQIRSGKGKVRYRMDKKQGWAFRVPEMPGVQIALDLRAKNRS
jgi:hypothetical protein